MKTLTTHTRILFMALVILATFFLSPIPCLADSHIRDDAPKKGPIEAAAGVVGVVATGATEAVEVIATVATGAIDAANKAVLEPVATGATGTVELTNEIVVKPAMKVLTWALEVVTFGLWGS